MKLQHIVIAACAATSLYALAASSIEKVREPWLVAGASPDAYEAGIDHNVTISGKGAKFLRSLKSGNESWATLMQQFSAEPYRGKRIRFQARVKTQDVNLWAGLWMRVDTPQEYSAAFYNSQDKPIKGSTDWQLRSVVLDVPTDAGVISFGVIDEGNGEVWLDDLQFEIVGKDVPVDQMPNPKKLPTQPSL